MVSADNTSTSNDLFLTPPEVDSFLRKYFSYYLTINDGWKKTFCDRVIYIAKTKNFVGNNGFVPNNQVRVIISASAVQLTLGLETWDLQYFQTILVFPNDFFNKQTGLKLKGETNLSGYISLSWKSFLQGYKISDDNLNLGIHEFTHALRFNGIRSENTDYFFSNYFTKWYCIGEQEFSNLSRHKPSIFRAYGGANVNEFLSVVTEHFFESPEQFKTELPHLYSATSILLNQKRSGVETEINVRNQQLDLQPTLSELPKLNLNVSFFKTTSAYVGLIFLGLGIFTFLKAGALAFPTLFLVFIGFLNLIVSDYKHTAAVFEPSKISISKGFFLFKNRKVFNLTFSHLISADFYSENKNEESITLTFFHSDDYFYEETFRFVLSHEQKQELCVGLKKNFVWVKIIR